MCFYSSIEIIIRTNERKVKQIFTHEEDLKSGLRSKTDRVREYESTRVPMCVRKR